MTEKEYLEAISKLDIEIYDKSEYEQVLKFLEEIFLIKPIRLEWFTTKADIMLDLGNNMADISNMMNGKFWALYNYCGIIKSYKIFLKLAEKRNDTIDYKRFQNLIHIIISNYSNDDKEIEDSCEWLNDNKEKEILIKREYIKRNNSIIGKLVECYYIKQNYIPYLILQLMCKNIDNMEKHTIRPWITKISNIGYLIERIVEDKKDLFIVLIDNFEDKLDCEIIANALHRIGKKVILIDIPLKVEIENEIFLKDTLSTSFDSIEKYPDKTVIHSIELIYNGQSIGDNRDYIIDYICKEFIGNNLATVLCS